ncbi:AraC family transcriptional regulator [Paenibacillus sp. GCM10023248]|uniref:AraC family transcriptional regulator n=1 Tax=Bacillales TaxID=1385 RepID=UPI002379B850|nr:MULTISPECIES: AraC family transcriptional regulator [Bacillales]MDD9268881.1 AraC family transcriptional regulator [Paenibacillus sp. MAHUQ-63]MDR6882040.1 AraC-like DNA-binding protein [Bacillus sp. 3255]
MSTFTVRELVLGDYFGKVVCEPNWRWHRAHKPFHDFDLWYVWDGEGEVTLNGTERKVGPGDCFLFRPGDFTSAAHNPHKPLTVTYIHFAVQGNTGDQGSKIEDAIIPLPSHVHFDSAEAYESYLDRFIHVRMSGAYGSHEEAVMLLKLLLLLFERQAPANQALGDTARRSMHKVMTDVAAHIMQDPGHPFSIAQLAKLAHLSPRYFSIKFREIMGQSLESFIIDKRIERATYLLKLGMTVNEVAEALGYRSIYFFSRQYKKVTGKAPSAMRS